MDTDKVGSLARGRPSCERASYKRASFNPRCHCTIAPCTSKVMMVDNISRLNSTNQRLAHQSIHIDVLVATDRLVHPSRSSRAHLSSVSGCIMNGVWRIGERRRKGRGVGESCAAMTLSATLEMSLHHVLIGSLMY